MEEFNSLRLGEKCAILHEHGKFVASYKYEKHDNAIYLLDRSYNFEYAVMFTDTEKLGVLEITILKNWDVADYITISLKDLDTK
jgi:hypothetical protein